MQHDIATVRTPGAGTSVPSWLRSSGALDVSFRRRGSDSVIHRNYQAGCLRSRMVRDAGPNAPPCAVFLNGAGGMAEGDRLDQRVSWAEGASGIVTTQAAERIYRAMAGHAAISNRLEVAEGASAEWLPQEAILFDGARLQRDCRIVLADKVTFLGVEAVVLGRAARGETVGSGLLRDRMRIWRNGRLIYADSLELSGDMERLMQCGAIGNGSRCLAVLIHASDGADALLPPVRNALERAEGRAAASSWNGLLAVRLLAPCGETLRHDMILALQVLRQGKPLPRVWNC